MVSPTEDYEVLRLVAIGPETDLTGWCAEQCVLGTGMALLDVMAADDGRRRVEQAQRLIELAPDIVLFTGSMEGGDNTWLAPLLDLLIAVRRSMSPQVVYAGNSQAAPLVLGLLGGDVLLLPNPYPEPDAEQFSPVRAALVALAEARQTGAHPPHREFIRHALECLGGVPKSEPNSFQLLAYLGSSAVLIASRRDNLVHHTTSPFGLGKGMLAAAERIDMGRLVRLLGRPLDEVEWLDYCGNRSLLPVYPPPPSELPLLRAVAGELFHLALADHLSLHPEQQPDSPNARWWEKLGPAQPLFIRPGQLIVGGEWLSCLTSTPAQLVAILLNGLQPEGIIELCQVVTAGLPSPQSSASLSGCIRPDLKLLATAVCPVGLPAGGRVALTVQSVEGNQRLVVRSGEQVTLDFARGKSLGIEIQPAREVDLGAGVGCTVKRTISGGAIGLVIDCRGRRPLPLPSRPTGENAGSHFCLSKGGERLDD